MNCAALPQCASLTLSSGTGHWEGLEGRGGRGSEEGGGLPWLRPTVEEPDTREHRGLSLLSGLTQPGASGGAFLNPAPWALSCCPSETSLGPRLPPPGFTAVLGCVALAGILLAEYSPITAFQAGAWLGGCWGMAGSQKALGGLWHSRGELNL